MIESTQLGDEQNRAGATEVQDEQLDAVSGGAIYMKVEGVKGQVQPTGDRPTEALSLNFTKIQY